MKCKIKHQFGDQTCNRNRGHPGVCRCKTESNGRYSEWYSKDGKYDTHKGYYVKP